jgi:hypothetical protein
MMKSIIALAVALLAISPLFVGMAVTGVMGGSYITDNTFRHFPPEERPVKYAFADELIKYLNKVLLPLLIIAAFFVWIMTVAEYYKFYKMFKLEEAHAHGGEEH